MAKHGADEGWRQHVINNVLPRMEATSPAGTAGFEPGPANPQAFSAGVHLQPPFDVIEHLPPVAQEKLRALRLRSADSHAVIPPFSEIQTASAERVAAANALKRLSDHPHDGGFGLKSDSRQVTEAQRTLGRATEEFERIKQRSETKTAAWQAASGALANAETWLKSGRPSGVLLQDQETEVPKLAKGENGVLDAIENRRRRVRELRADLHRIRSAPFPSAHAKQQMREQIEALAMQGGPSVSLLIEHDGKIVWPMQMTRSELRGGERPALAFSETLDAVALTCWLHKSALIAALDREIGTESDDPASLSHEAREKAEAEVMGDLLDIERQEAALVFQAQQSLLPCEHRADISPVALLGLRLVTAPRPDLPRTSPEHGYDIVGGRR
ncbi:hypothetical protein ABIB94_008102 [Bradyrhizobium sp. JR7.2]|uniref:hypothetical protein n=1 Tax=unclassified Bradyrhizobium TaxID=2631580 RepID=UPI003394C57E